MLRHLRELEAAAAVERAVDAVVQGGDVRTADLGGSSSTMEVAEAIAAAIPYPDGPRPGSDGSRQHPGWP
jgi:isocitrate/isopropylmalate dehydrogenase